MNVPAHLRSRPADWLLGLRARLPLPGPEDSGEGGWWDWGPEAAVLAQAAAAEAVAEAAR